MLITKEVEVKITKQNIDHFCDKLNKNYNNYYKNIIDFFILKYNPTNITYNIDRGWSNHEIFIDCGFEIKEKTNPNVFYVKGHKRILNDESELYRIYDSGNLMMIFKTK